MSEFENNIYIQLNLGLVSEVEIPEMGRTNFPITVGGKRKWLRNNTEVGMLRILVDNRGTVVPSTELAKLGRRPLRLTSIAPYISHIGTAIGEDYRNPRIILRAEDGYLLAQDAPEIII